MGTQMLLPENIWPDKYCHDLDAFSFGVWNMNSGGGRFFKANRKWISTAAKLDLLADAGAKTTCVNCNPSGLFVRPSEPLKEHVGYVGNLMKKSKFACAVVHDGDADRVAVVANGQLIPGDILIGYVAEYYLKANDKLILSLDCSQEVFQYIKDVGRQPIYTPVGQNLLIAEAKKQKAAFIGEYSGHYSFNEFMYYSDPFYFVGVVSEVQPSDLLSFQAQFHNVILRERVQGKIEYNTLQHELEQWTDQLILIDGIKAVLEEEDAAILIRHSQSEPITRINVEAKTLKSAHQIFERIQRLLGKISGLKGD